MKKHPSKRNVRSAGPFRRLFADKRGAIAIIAALALPAVIGLVALAVEFGRGLLIRDETQRVADEAAYAGALAYVATGQQSSILPAAQAIAVLNGVPATGVTASLLASSPRNAASQAVQATITTRETILLGQVVGFGNAVTIGSTSTAEVSSGATPCILALNASGSGVSLSGGTRISAPNCAVASQASVVVPCGDTITAKDIYYNGSAPSQPCSGISGPVKKVSSADPLAGNAGVVAANARAVADESLTSPTAPSVPGGTAVTFSGTQPTLPTGCTATYANGNQYWASNWTVTCAAGGTYNFAALTVSGGITVTFSGSATNTYNFSGTVTNNGASLTFGSGTFNMAGGLVNGSQTTFGAGTFNIGAASSCSYSICNGGGSTITFGGPSTFVISSGVSNAGGATILRSGSNNSYSIGPSRGGYALNLGGSAVTTFSDATGSSSLFQIVGNVYESGGACTTFPAASNHDINGSVSLGGGLTLGAGLYAVAGSFLVGASGGGDVWCQSVNANVGVNGAGVTIAVAGSGATAGSNVVVVGAGFSHVTISAPTTGTYQSVAIVGPLSDSNTGASLTEGASGTTIGGAIYFPNGPMTLSGGASVGNGSGECLEIVATAITLTGGTSITAAPCFASSGGSRAPLLVD